MRPELLGKISVISMRSVFYQNYLNCILRLYSSSSSVKPSSLSVKINDESELLNPTYKIIKNNNRTSNEILIDKYHNLIDSKKFRYDRKQFDTLFVLSSFYRQILNYQVSNKPIWSNQKLNKFIKYLIKNSEENELPKMKSIYLYGGVGCGKTMMMDLVYNSIPETKLKQRIHFNKFMLNVHQSIHDIKQIEEYKNQDPIQVLCDNLIKKVHFLFFDEFQVTDIADAMLMSRLFTGLMQRGMVVFFTSNRIPTDLYKNGLQRELFLPFIDYIYKVCQIIHIDSIVDYRKISSKSENQVYFNSDYESNILNEYIGNMLPEGAVFERRKINILGREVCLEQTYKNLLVTNYSFICQEARGSVDYLEFCKLFDIIIMKDIPFIDMKNGDSLRRFITFVDALYDNNICFICSGKASSPQYLFDLTARQNIGEHTSKLEDEYFAIDRTISRLIDMQSETYLNKTKFLNK